MISVALMTYRRKNMLQEAIQSFLEQDRPDCELIIVNDDVNVKYELDKPYDNIFVFNCNRRFSCIGKKLKFAFDNASYEHIYRLDDDDLLNLEAMDTLSVHAELFPGYDLWRSNEVEFFIDNAYKGRGSSVNNGNMFSKKYINSISKWDLFKAEDTYMVVDCNPNTLTINKPTMLYRWGMETYHISAVNPDTKEGVYNYVDNLSLFESGKTTLVPGFERDYYGQIKNALQQM